MPRLNASCTFGERFIGFRIFVHMLSCLFLTIPVEEAGALSYIRFTVVQRLASSYDLNLVLLPLLHIGFFGIKSLFKKKKYFGSTSIA